MHGDGGTLARRITIILGLAALFNIYAGYAIIGRSAWADAHPFAAWLMVAGFFLLQLAGPFGDRLFFAGHRRRAIPGFFVGLLDWASYITFGVMSCLVVFGLVADIVTILWTLIAPPVSDHAVLLVLLGATGLTVLVGLVQATQPAVRHIDVPLHNLPPAFDGFKIAQISDLHVGPTIGRRYARKVVEITNALMPDAVALTGDFVDGTVADFAADVAPLADLRAPEGVFYVTGNHEYFWDAGQWIAVFKQLGARVLVNEHALIHRGNATIAMAGVTDISTRYMTGVHAFSPQRALAGVPQDMTKILLAHQPISFTAAAEAGADLQLSGHTHAGQYFPFTLLIGFFQRYVRGLNRHGNMWVYVNSGTGYWGPPLRTGAPPEITLLTLRRA